MQNSSNTRYTTQQKTLYETVRQATAPDRGLNRATIAMYCMARAFGPVPLGQSCRNGHAKLPCPTSAPVHRTRGTYLAVIINSLNLTQGS